MFFKQDRKIVVGNFRPKRQGGGKLALAAALSPIDQEVRSSEIDVYALVFSSLFVSVSDRHAILALEWRAPFHSKESPDSAQWIAHVCERQKRKLLKS